MLETKVDKLQEDVTDIKVTIGKMEVTLADNNESWKEHMKRTRISERRLDILEGVWYALCTGGAVFTALYAMGVIQKLFS